MSFGLSFSRHTSSWSLHVLHIIFIPFVEAVDEAQVYCLHGRRRQVDCAYFQTEARRQRPQIPHQFRPRAQCSQAPSALHLVLLIVVALSTISFIQEIIARLFVLLNLPHRRGALGLNLLKSFLQMGAVHLDDGLLLLFVPH